MGSIYLAPPGVRFSPTDVELVMYLRSKINGRSVAEVISEVDIYKFAPWDLPGESCLQSRDLEWYFFCPQDGKCARGSRRKRATKNGYWKITGEDKPIRHEFKTVAFRRTLIFHEGKPSKGCRTDWVMHEYRIEDKELIYAGISKDAYVVCKIFKKSGKGSKNGEQHGAPFNEEDWDGDLVNVASTSAPPSGVIFLITFPERRENMSVIESPPNSGNRNNLVEPCPQDPGVVTSSRHLPSPQDVDMEELFSQFLDKDDDALVSNGSGIDKNTETSCPHEITVESSPNSRNRNNLVEPCPQDLGVVTSSRHLPSPQDVDMEELLSQFHDMDDGALGSNKIDTSHPHRSTVGDDIHHDGQGIFNDLEDFNSDVVSNPNNEIYTSNSWEDEYALHQNLPGLSNEHYLELNDLRLPVEGNGFEHVMSASTFSNEPSLEISSMTSNWDFEGARCPTCPMRQTEETVTNPIAWSPAKGEKCESSSVSSLERSSSVIACYSGLQLMLDSGSAQKAAPTVCPSFIREFPNDITSARSSVHIMMALSGVCAWGMLHEISLDILLQTTRATIFMRSSWCHVHVCLSR